MAVGDKIRTVDYNSVQTKLANLIGAGSGSFGWGQTVNSSQVSVSNKITVNEWANLRNDIINGFRHINSGTPETVQATVNSIIKFNASGTTPQEATEVVVQYDRWADELIANRFTVHPTQAKTDTISSQSRSTWDGGFWNTRLSCTVTATFTSAAQARYFFNSGSQIRFESSRSGGTTTRLQNISWTNLLNSAGIVPFGAQLPDTGFSPMNGRNFYRLTNAYQVWFVDNATNRYTANRYQISARSNVVNNANGTANIVEFLVEWIDGYQDPGPPEPGDEVDGTITLTVSAKEADGFLVPAAAGSFTVEVPTVTIGSIIQDPNGRRTR